ncbi:MAG: hypothetical protein ACRDHP_07250, partial [Ktedonobacterales bacterium]
RYICAPSTQRSGDFALLHPPPGYAGCSALRSSRRDHKAEVTAPVAAWTGANAASTPLRPGYVSDAGAMPARRTRCRYAATLMMTACG